VNTQPEFEAVERQLAELEVLVETEHASARRASRFVLGAYVAMFGLVIAFVSVNYNYISEELSPSNFEAGLQKQVERLSPVAMEQAIRLGETLLPVYAREAQSQLADRMPEIERKLAHETAMFAQELRQQTMSKLSASEQRVREATEISLSHAYPELDSPEAKAEFVMKFEAMTQDALADALVEFDKRFRGEVDELMEMIARSDLGYTDEPTHELQKRFLHLWLVLIDEELMKS